MPKPLKLPLPPGWGSGVDPLQVKTACAMGIDVRPNSWDIAIGDVWRPRPDQPVVRLLFYGKVRDDDDVEYLANQYPVRCGAGDARPEFHTMLKLAERLRAQGKKFWRAQYNTNATNNVKLTENRKEWLLTADRTGSLDEVFFAAQSGLGLALPANFRDICGGDFVRELCNPTRVPELRKGEEYHVWTKGKDHPLHALGYLFIALQAGKLWSGGGSTEIFAMPGSTVGTIRDSVDDGESGYVDICEPSVADDGRMTWTDDTGMGVEGW